MSYRDSSGEEVTALPWCELREREKMVWAAAFANGLVLFQFEAWRLEQAVQHANKSVHELRRVNETTGEIA